MSIEKARAATFWVIIVAAMWAFVIFMTNGGNFDVSWWTPLCRFFVAVFICLTMLAAGCTAAE